MRSVLEVASAAPTSRTCSFPSAVRQVGAAAASSTPPAVPLPRAVAQGEIGQIASRERADADADPHRVSGVLPHRRMPSGHPRLLQPAHPGPRPTIRRHRRGSGAYAADARSGPAGGRSRGARHPARPHPLGNVRRRTHRHARPLLFHRARNHGGREGS